MGKRRSRACLAGLLLALLGLVGCSGNIEASDGTDASVQLDGGIDASSSGPDAADASWEQPLYDVAADEPTGDVSPTEAAIEAESDVVPKLIEVVVEPSSAVCLECSYLQFEAEAIFDDGFSQVITQEASWTSNAPAIAVVEGPGLVLGLSEGTATISAELQGILGTAQLTVPNTSHFEQFGVTPSTLALPLGGSAQLEALYTGWAGCDAGTETWSMTGSATWTSSDESVATVDVGFVTALGAGAATIQAQVGGYVASAEITVVPADAGAD